MRKNYISYKIVRLFTITMLGTCAFAVAEGNYRQPTGSQSRQDRGTQDSSYNREYSDSDRTMSQTAKDAWIQGKLEATLAYNQELSSFAINSEVKQGVVYLKGNVETQTAKQLATQLASNIEGVSKVENNLRVVPDTDNEG
jgi:osmotically-inducible protein OsmY